MRLLSSSLHVAPLYSGVYTDAALPLAGKEVIMRLKQLFVTVPAALLFLGTAPANAGKTIEEAGALACVMDKWDEKEIEKGHKLVDSSARCIDIPNDPADPKYSQVCPGKYEYMPDGSWKASGTCTDTYKDGDTKFESWEEGSHLKDYRYKITGGTGKYKGAGGGGTYIYENLTDTLSGGSYKGTIELP
jgi:hypothetical protein